MPLPDSNQIFTPIDARTFYVSKTSSEQISVDALQAEIKEHQEQINTKTKLLNDAQASIGVDISTK